MKETWVSILTSSWATEWVTCPESCSSVMAELGPNPRLLDFLLLAVGLSLEELIMLTSHYPLNPSFLPCKGPCLFFFNCPPTFLPPVAENDSSHNQDHPRQLGDSIWGEENRGWDILGKKYLGNWVKWCCHSLLSWGKWKESREKSRVLFIPGFLSRWMGKPRKNLTPVGH